MKPIDAKKELLGTHVPLFDWKGFEKQERERLKETSEPLYPFRRNASSQAQVLLDQEVRESPAEHSSKSVY